VNVAGHGRGKKWGHSWKKNWFNSWMTRELPLGIDLFN
jgi:hypothetical protein